MLYSGVFVVMSSTCLGSIEMQMYTALHYISGLTSHA